MKRFYRFMEKSCEFSDKIKNIREEDGEVSIM